MIEDLLLALRGLRRNRGFTVLAVLVLGIGIGATTTVFTAVDAVLLRPLPYPGADRIAMVVRRQGPVDADSQNGVTFRFIRDNQQSFRELSATAGPAGVNMLADDRAAYVRMLSVTSEYFRVLGFEPTIGRTFSRAEEDPGAPAAVVLSHASWQRYFGGRSDILGRELRLTGQPYTIVGVMPADFRTLFPVDVWTQLKSNDGRGIGSNYSVIGRLKEDVTFEQADAEYGALTQSFLQTTPRGLPRDTTLGIRPLQNMLNLTVGESVRILFGAVLAMLLIACANTASLVFVRTLNRQREFAVRAAIGASRWHIVRQLLIETLVLSTIGSLFGLWFADWGVGLLVSLDPNTYAGWNLAIDMRVLAALALGTLIVGLAVGLLPALQSSRIDLRSKLIEEGRQTSSQRVAWWRRTLVTVEIAGCLVLLSAAVLLIRSYVKLQEIPLGFDRNNVLTVQMSLQGPRYDKEGRTTSFVSESLSQIRALPGVEAAAIASNLPAQRGLNITYRTAAGQLTSPDWRYITPDYFKVFRIPLVKGRYLEETDRAGAPAAAVVNEQFARQFLQGTEPLGAPLTFVVSGSDIAFNVIGVIGDVKSGNFRAPAAPTVFVTLSQAPPEMMAIAHQYYPVNFAIRTVPGVESSGLATAVARVVQASEPDLPLASTRSMDDVIAAALRGQRAQTTLFIVFATLALITAASGIYGVISYSVISRTREFGIRIALGSTYSGVMAAVVRQGIILAAIGTGIGFAGALVFSSMLRGYLFGVTARDPWTFAITALVLLLVAVGASTVPALRVLKVSPSVALRNE